MPNFPIPQSPLLQALGLSILAGLCPVAEAEVPAPLGDDALVNTTDYSSEDDLDSTEVEMASDGSFVVTWNAEDASYFFSNNVNARRYAADGTTIGDDFQVTSFDLYPSLQPDLAVDASGFLVVWEDDETSPRQLYARTLGLGGALGESFPVTAEPSEVGQREPAVGGGTGGGFVVTWQEYSSNGDIMAQRLDSAGDRLGSPLLVDSPEIAGDALGDVAVADDGRFAITWRAPDGVALRLFDPAGAPLAAEIALEPTATVFLPSQPKIAFGHESYFVAWAAGESSGLGDGSGFGIRARILDRDAAFVTPPMTINSVTSGDQLSPDVAATPQGFVVTWTGPDADGQGLRGQLFSAAGAPLGQEVALNTTTPGDQGIPTVAAGDNSFVAAWLDAETTDIRVRRFESPLFTDGFETGDTTVWHLTVE